MKKHFIRYVFLTLSFIILVFSLFNIFNFLKYTDVFSSNASNEITTIIVDAGHGGEDGGAVAPDGTNEKDINLDIAIRLEKILSFYGYNVIMTRTIDTMTCDDGLKTQREKKISDIRNRFKIIKDNPDALFVSVHQNKFSDSTQSGAQVFYSANNIKSKQLADSIQNSLKTNLQKNNKRLTKKAGTDIYLLYHSQIPSVLVECGFLSNLNDLNALKTDEYRQITAFLIADGIIKYSLNR